ncbi:MAG: BACON domain-containing protein [Bacteroidales bacterium]
MKRIKLTPSIVISLFFMIVVLSGCNKSTRSAFPIFPPEDVTSLADRDQMLEQLGIVLPVLPPKAEDQNAPADAFPVNPANPEGNWTDSGRINTITRSPFGLWNNYSDRSDGLFPGPDSARVGDYTPIDLLRMNNGRKISTPDEWWNKRRPEVEKDLEEALYGKVPDEELIPGITWDVKSSTGGKGNSAYIQKQITGTIDISGYPQVRNNPAILATLRIPANVTEPVPVFIFFGGFGNAADMYWERCNRHGWGVCVFDLNALQPDNGAGLTSYLIGLVNRGNWRKPDDWGTLRAWSWGVSRLIDYFETDKDVNSKMIGLNGVSRYGKATLVTMAFEPRLAIAFPGDAGSLGTKLNRRHWGQDLEHSTPANEYHWMAGNFFKWAGELVPGQYLPRKIEKCPVDAHSLLALCAPRPVMMDGGTTSTWCDPYGVYLTGKYATPVYELLGVEGLVMPDTKPVVDKAYIDGKIAYRVHDGGHTDAPDWPAFLEFAANNLDIATLWTSVASLNISSEKESQTVFNITSTRSWTIECTADWLTVDRPSGSGDDTVTVTAAPNTEASGRQAILTIKTSGREQRVIVNQASSKPQLSLAPDVLAIGGGENNGASFDIKSNTAWNIGISYVTDPGARQMFMMSPADWLSVSEEAGVNSRTVTLTASVNPGINRREALITVSADGVKPHKLTITQEEGAPTLMIRADTLKFSSEGGSASPLFVMTNSTWTAECTEEWITAIPGTGGNFSQVTISAKENTSKEERTGTVSFTVPGLEPRIIVIMQKPPRP